MTHQIFELHLAQAESFLKKIRNLKFSDSRKKYHLKQLKQLFKRIKAKYSTFNEDELNIARQCIDYFLLWDFEFLSHSSDKSIVPTELIFCVERVLNEWVIGSEAYIVVTSLNNKFDSYSFQFIPDDKLTILEPFIKKKFDIEFKHKLLLINMPEPLATDFLSNVILFHEIGHFIDKKEKIIEKLFNSEPQIKRLENSINPDDRWRYFAYKNHYHEYFADLFASQYINNSCSQYLNYFAYNDEDSVTHPSTNDRIALVQKFISGTQDDVIDLIQKYTLKITSKILSKKNLDIRGDFNNGNTISISNEGEVFTLFIKGWECWVTSDDAFPRKSELGLLHGYQKLNELIGNSIRIYINSLSTKEVK